jgi:hypothetical protein
LSLLGSQLAIKSLPGGNKVLDEGVDIKLAKSFKNYLNY